MAGALSTVAMSAVMLGAKRTGVTGELPPERITRTAIDAVSVEPLDDHTRGCYCRRRALRLRSGCGCAVRPPHDANGGRARLARDCRLHRHALRDGYLARELSGLGASPRHYAARIRRPARARGDDARRPLGLRRGTRDSREAASALALVTTGRAGVKNGSGRGPTDSRPRTHSAEGRLRVCAQWLRARGGAAGGVFRRWDSACSTPGPPVASAMTQSARHKTTTNAVAAKMRSRNPGIGTSLSPDARGGNGPMVPPTKRHRRELHSVERPADPFPLDAAGRCVHQRADRLGTGRRSIQLHRVCQCRIGQPASAGSDAPGIPPEFLRRGLDRARCILSLRS